MLGHVAPAQLGFRGGRGLGPALGGMLVLDSWVAAIALAVAVLCGLATRAFTASGLVGVAAAPVAALVLGEPRTALAAGLTARSSWPRTPAAGRPLDRDALAGGGHECRHDGWTRGSTRHSSCSSHCIPSAKRPGISIASITPSGARAETISPIATASTAW